MGKAVSFLWVLTPISSTISVIIVWVAMATSDWIRTQERILNSHYNGTTDYKYILKMTYSGIWEICAVTVADGDTDISCEMIEYFTSEPYYPDSTDSSLAIPYAVRHSVFFFIVASLIQLFGELGYLYGHYVRERKVFVFIGGTIFIVSGLTYRKNKVFIGTYFQGLAPILFSIELLFFFWLVMLIGVVMYVSIFKTEVSSKLKPNMSSQSSFNFQYGVSFLLYLSGFICVELSGTCAILLFVYQDQTIYRVHFMQPSPVIFRNHKSTADSDMLYPCQIHSDLYTAMDTLSYHSGQQHGSERLDINHRYYLDPDDSPPYGLASQISPLEEYAVQYNLEKERVRISTQSATTQTVSLIYNPLILNDTKVPSKTTCPISENGTSEQTEVHRKSTLV